MTRAIDQLDTAQLRGGRKDQSHLRTFAGQTYDPYFDLAPTHVSGHINAPNKPDSSGFDAGVEFGGQMYLAHPLFGAYKRIGAVAVLEITEKAIGHALGRRQIEMSLPRAGRAALRRQAAKNRDVVHLLHANPTLRGAIGANNIQPIQDLTTLRTSARRSKRRERWPRLD